MKDAEDEAFDDLAKKQGSWGGGFQAKRAAAADKLKVEDDDDTQVYKKPWVGLTDEEIRDCLGPEAVCIPPGWSRLTRAIEAKLKEKNNG